MNRIRLAIAALMVGTTISTGALAVVPELIPLQGILADELGDPIDDTVTMTFRMYASSDASSAIWTEVQPVAVDNGFFAAYLGDFTALPSDFPTYNEVWLGVTVDSDPEMERFQLGAVPYALEAQRCERVGSLTEDDINSGFAPVGSGVPAGAVMFFNLAACPAGWSPLVAGQGRVVVGVAPGGAGTTVGTPLASGGGRTITEAPSHLHSVDPASQTVTVGNENAHTHSVTINPDGFDTASGGSHSHTASSASNSHDHFLYQRQGAFATAGNGDYACGGCASSGTTANSYMPIADDTHSHTITVNTTNSDHFHAIDVPSTTSTSGTGSTHTHTATFDMSAFNTASAGSAAVDVTMPYLQLLVCVKD